MLKKVFVLSCEIVTHFIDKFGDRELVFKHLALVILDVVNNTSGLACNEIEPII